MKYNLFNIIPVRLSQPLSNFIPQRVFQFNFRHRPYNTYIQHHITTFLNDKTIQLVPLLTPRCLSHDKISHMDVVKYIENLLKRPQNE